MEKLYLLLAALFLAPPAHADADFDSEKVFNELAQIHQTLSPQDQDRLNRGETVLFAQPHPGSTIPHVYIFKMVDASPEEIAAIMSDYDRHKNYFQSGKMKKSEVVQQFSPLDVAVHYEIEIIPIFFYEEYTLRSRMARYNQNQSYRIDRVLMTGKTVRAIEGVARAEPMGNRALVMYYGFIDPGVAVSEKSAIQSIRDIVESLKLQVDKEKAKQPDLLAEQLQRLRSKF